MPVTAPVPILVFGQVRARINPPEYATLLQYGVTNEDTEGLPVLFYGRSAEVALAGVGGKISFRRLFVAITFTHPFRIRVTPIVDGKVTDGEWADIQVDAADFADPLQELVEGVRTSYLFEVSLSEAYFRGGIERFRQALQGAYFQLEVEQMEAMPDDADLIVERVELEYKVLSKSPVQ